MTLPPKNVSLAECFNASKENADDEDGKSALHARIQARGDTALVESGQSIAAAARMLGVVEQSLFNWVKAQRQGNLTGADRKGVSAARPPEGARTVAEGTPVNLRTRLIPGSRFVVLPLPLALALVVGAWNLYVALHNGGLVRGRVVGPDGQPVGGATVHMAEQNFTTNAERGKTVSAADGTFEFTDNRSHNIQLRADKQGMGRSAQQVVRLYFRAQNVELADPLQIEPR